MRSTWTDSRLDDLNHRVTAIGDRVTELSGRVSDLDSRLTGRIDALQHVMVQAFIALMVAMFTGFVGLAGLIVTQL